MHAAAICIRLNVNAMKMLRRWRNSLLTLVALIPLGQLIYRNYDIVISVTLIETIVSYSNLLFYVSSRKIAARFYKLLIKYFFPVLSNSVHVSKYFQTMVYIQWTNYRVGLVSSGNENASIRYRLNNERQRNSYDQNFDSNLERKRKQGCGHGCPYTTMSRKIIRFEARDFVRGSGNTRCSFNRLGQVYGARMLDVHYLRYASPLHFSLDIDCRRREEAR